MNLNYNYGYSKTYRISDKEVYIFLSEIDQDTYSYEYDCEKISDYCLYKGYLRRTNPMGTYMYITSEGEMRLKQFKRELEIDKILNEE